MIIHRHRRRILLYSTCSNLNAVAVTKPMQLNSLLPAAATTWDKCLPSKNSPPTFTSYNRGCMYALRESEKTELKGEWGAAENLFLLA